MIVRSMSSINTDHSEEEPVFVAFHGYGNDEQEMIRIIQSINAQADYIAFRAGHDRPYLGGCAWYQSPRAHAHDTDESEFEDVEAIEQQCSAICDDIVDMLDSTIIHNRPLILIGFSQGAYLAYRFLVEHTDLFAAAILLSPSFHDATESEPLIASERTPVLLAYGERDNVITLEEQHAIEESLSRFTDLITKRYENMGHDIIAQEIVDIRKFLS